MEKEIKTIMEILLTTPHDQRLHVLKEVHNHLKNYYDKEIKQALEITHTKESERKQFADLLQAYNAPVIENKEGRYGI